jgi:hypothetical protein
LAEKLLCRIEKWWPPRSHVTSPQASSETATSWSLARAKNPLKTKHSSLNNKFLHRFLLCVSASRRSGVRVELRMEQIDVDDMHQ